WVRPRRARWKACEWTFARPGSVKPSSRIAPAGGSVMWGVTAANLPFFTSSRTSGMARSPPSQAWRAHQLGRQSRPETGDKGGGAAWELVALEPLVLLPGGKGGRVLDPVHKQGAVEVVDFMLEGDRRQAPDFSFDRATVAVEGSHPDLDETTGDAAK